MTGCSGGLSFEMVWILRALTIAAFGSMMAPSGDYGASSSNPCPRGNLDLNRPPQEEVEVVPIEEQKGDVYREQQGSPNLDLTLAPPIANSPEPVVTPSSEEIRKIIERLPKKELESIMGKSKITNPIDEYSAESRASLHAIARQHFFMKNEILKEMASLYPSKGWECCPLIRETFFLGRGERELDLITLTKIIEGLKTEKKKFFWAHELNHRLENWNWKE